MKNDKTKPTIVSEEEFKKNPDKYKMKFRTTSKGETADRTNEDCYLQKPKNEKGEK